ncbi:MAG TPA: hypothetical protein VI030_08550 [Propionibacteriaceae bacterium]
MTEPTNQASTADLSRYAISHQPLSAPPDHGEFHIELEGRDAVVLKPNQAFSVPAGMLHRPVVPVAARSS